jgi:two-component system sensor histidine kinase UhpB
VTENDTGAAPGYISLFWRLFLPNAAVLCGASVVLTVAPPRGRILVILGGLLVLLFVNLVLMRRAFAPLQRLAGLMARFDPLAPGERLDIETPESEVSVVARSFNDMLERLEGERRQSERRRVAAQEAERRRVAAELHDEIGQSLTALALQLERTASLPPGEAPSVQEAATTARAILDDVRAVARRLRPDALDHLGLASALAGLCERMSRDTGVRIESELDRRLPPLDADAELAIYRVAQESLTNAVRHAQPSRVALRLEGFDRAVRLTVADDGPGLDPDSVHPEGGIRGMRERAVGVGGHLRLANGTPRGVRVELLVPAVEQEA